MKYSNQLRIFVLALALLSGQTAWAQDTETPESTETPDVESSTDIGDSADETALFEGVRELPTPDGSNEYGEIHQMRVLERTFLPPETQQTTGDAGTLLPADYMGLSPMPIVPVVSDGIIGGESSRGLQRQASRWMADAVAEVRRQISDSSGKLNRPFDLDCANEPAVQEYVAIFSSAAAGTMKTWLKRLERWRPVLEKALAQEGVPTDLMYLAMIESGFKPRVKSPMAAAGMWQFMAGTGVEMGLKIDAYVDERYDPIKAAHAAAQYLKKQYNRYNSWPLAMAAYNGGPGTVNVAIDRYNTTNYFKLVEYGAMYDETRRYVPRILAAALIGRNPSAFGFDGLKPEPPFIFDTVEVPGDTKLQLLAQAAGCSVDTLKDLNPELLKETTPPGRNYELRIPQGKHADFVQKFDNVQKKYANSKDIIVLRFGESIENLAEDIGTPARVLRNLNGLAAKQPAAYGSEMFVPNGSKRGANAKSREDDDLPLALVSPEKFIFQNRERVFYQTQSGDSIREIAAAFGVLPNQIAIWNELDVWAKLRSKMILQIFVSDLPDPQKVRFFRETDMHVVTRGSAEHQEIIDARRNANAKSAKAAAKANPKPGSKSTSTSKSSSKSDKSEKSAAPAKPAKPRYVMHTVKKGESLSKIAAKYGVTVEQLMKLNGLTEKSAIRKGQELKIKKE